MRRECVICPPTRSIQVWSLHRIPWLKVRLCSGRQACCPGHEGGREGGREGGGDSVRTGHKGNCTCTCTFFVKEEAWC